ncbi:sensor histidine kinase [Niabella drilacis]|uniref:histidine kinase n=1 Tax=Niabella drilacis (strain DSM 25811 / CCM 8410 / CCUG 62505 / LMG 26954 / E90) TaxID=1285928 RepID=A0A1G6U6X9_NIADE|nr:sensor histidine kinase [Niabella drilacis]SDD37051.1 Histidine kinase-, DNA gyrase B-, and HSP90-like ATPase [Niabella drilacis]
MPSENDKYNEVIIVIIAGIIIFWALIGCIVYFIMQYQRRRFQHAREKADLQSAFEKNLLQSRVEIQEQAFDQISRELHDNIGQQLSLAKLNLNTLKTIASQQDQDKIESSRELISNSIDQIRNISKTLLGEKINSIGIAEAIKNETERLNKTGIFEVSFTNASPTFELNPQKEIILFRMVQETLNNIIRHAGATHVMIRIGYEGTLLKIFIQDNGKGFNLETERISGIGLLNMKNRAQTIGAVLNITSAVDQGTTVEIILESS